MNKKFIYIIKFTQLTDWITIKLIEKLYAINCIQQIWLINSIKLKLIEWISTIEIKLKNKIKKSFK